MAAILFCRHATDMPQQTAFVFVMGVPSSAVLLSTHKCILLHTYATYANWTFDKVKHSNMYQAETSYIFMTATVAFSCDVPLSVISDNGPARRRAADISVTQSDSDITTWGFHDTCGYI
jgi:hypothetical protein